MATNRSEFSDHLTIYTMIELYKSNELPFANPAIYKLHSDCSQSVRLRQEHGIYQIAEDYTIAAWKINKKVLNVCGERIKRSEVRSSFKGDLKVSSAS